MKPEELLDYMEHGPLAPIYYLYGPESYFMDRARQVLVQRVFPGGEGRDLNYRVLAGKEIKGEAVAREALTVPMFFPYRLIVLCQLQLVSASELEGLLPYLKAPSESTCLLLLADSKIDGRSKFGRALSKAARSAQCRHPWENQLPPILRRMAGERDIKLDRGVETYLIDVVGSDLQALDDALERLRLYAGPHALIDLRTAERCIADTRVHQIWDLTDAIGERKLEQALKVLGRLRAEGMEALRALPLLARTMRQIWKAKALGQEGLSREELSKTLGLHPYVAGKVTQQARHFHTRDLVRALKALHAADLSLKSSELPSTVRSWVVLEELVWTLTRG